MAKILVCDDEQEIRDILRDALCIAGHQVDCVCDGFAASEILQDETYDIIIMDLIMPRRDGMEAIVDIKQQYPQINIIAISGGNSEYSSDSLLDITTHLGVVQTYAKPFDLKELITGIDQLMKS